MRRIICGSILLALSLALSPSGTAGPTPSAPKTFMGPVLEVAADGSFTMKGGSSKRYPRVRVSVDKQARFTGLPRKDRKVKVGDTVRVEGTMVEGDTFRAAVVHVFDPNEKPGTAGATRSN